MHKLLESSKKKQQRQNEEQFRRAHMSMMIESRRFQEEANSSAISLRGNETLERDSSSSMVDNASGTVGDVSHDDGQEDEGGDDFSMLRKQLEEFDRHGVVPEDIVPKLNLNGTNLSNLSPQRQQQNPSQGKPNKPRFSLRLRLPNFKNSGSSNNNSSNNNIGGLENRDRNRITPNLNINAKNSKAKRLSIAVKNFFSPTKKSPRALGVLSDLDNNRFADPGRRRAASSATPPRHHRLDIPDHVAKRSPRFRDEPDEFNTLSDTSMFATDFRDDDTAMSEMMDTDIPSDEEEEDELEMVGAPGSADHEISLKFIERHIASGTYQKSPRENASAMISPRRKDSAANILLISPRRRKTPKEVMHERHRTVMKMLKETYQSKPSEKVVALEHKRLKELSSFSPSLILQSLRRDEKLHSNYLKVNQYFAKKRGGPLEKAV